MPDLQDYFFVAKIIKVHGIKGELKVSFDVDNIADYINKNVFYIERHGNFHAFHVEYIKPFQNAFLLKFVEIKNRNEAETLLNRSIFLPIAELPTLEKDNQFYYHEILHAKVIDKNHGETGIIKEVLEMPAQDLIVISYLNKDILLPITDETIIKWDKKNKILYTHFPDGLREIYLS
jgi:16S rRNA processing protein RimM